MRIFLNNINYLTSIVAFPPDNIFDIFKFRGYTTLCNYMVNKTDCYKIEAADDGLYADKKCIAYDNVQNCNALVVV